MTADNTQTTSVGEKEGQTASYVGRQEGSAYISQRAARKQMRVTSQPRLGPFASSKVQDSVTANDGRDQRSSAPQGERKLTISDN